MISAVTAAVSSSFFWAYAAMVDLLAGFSSELMGRAEGCGCPGHQHACRSGRGRQDLNGHCQLKGRRAPELAAGQLQQVIDTFLSGALSQLNRAVLSFAAGGQNENFRRLEQRMRS